MSHVCMRVQRSVVHVLVLERGHGSLADVLEGGPLSDGEKLAILTRVGECLTALHDHGLVHCDVKPSNAVLFRDGPREVFKLIDLDACTAVDSVQSSAYTPQYCPPEMARAVRRTPPTSVVAHPGYDVFSFGLMSIHVLTGVSYWSGRAPDAIVSALCEESFSVRVPTTLSAETRRMLSLCVAPSVAKRRSMREVLDKGFFKLGVGKTTMMNVMKVREERERERGV